MAELANNNYKTIATKISYVDWCKLVHILKSQDLNVYVILQTYINAYIKYFSNDVETDEGTRKLVETFTNFNLTKKDLNLTSCNKQRLLFEEAIVLVGKKGTTEKQPLMIRKEGTQAKVIENTNNDSILTAFMNAFCPDLLPMLHAIVKKNEYYSITDALKECVKHEYLQNDYDITEEINELFADNCRHEFGNAFDYDEIGKYKNKYNRNIENM